MADTRSTPQYSGSLGDFVADLRARVFRSQQKAADYFSIIRSNISRYESGTYTAPVLYMTELARLYAEYSQADEKIHQELLREVNRAIIDLFESERPYRSWNDLSESGKRYIDLQREDRQSKDLSPSTANPEWFHFGEHSPNSSGFLGRQQEIETIKNWLIEDNCRVVSIVGLGGMGKTLLAKQVSLEIADSFQRIIWYSLQNRPFLDELLRNCVRLWTKNETEESSGDVSTLTNTFIDLLRAQKCLLILDNFESVFQHNSQVGNFLPGYENYGAFLRIVSEVDHNSSVLLTSREKPRELATKTGDALVQTLEIKGVDVALAQILLRSRNLQGTQGEWERFVHMFSGNLWILKMTSEMIKELHDNSIGRYLGRASGGLALDAHTLIDEQFKRASKLEHELLISFAIEQGPMNSQMLAESFDGIHSPNQIDDALLSLRRRSLIEPRGDGFTLPNVLFHDLISQIVERLIKEFTGKELDLLKSHTFLSARSAEYARQAQIRLFFEPVASGLLAKFRRLRYLEDHLLLLLMEMHQLPPYSRGHSGVNLLHLLVHLDADITRFSFADMPLRYACLQSADLRGVNFSDADFENSHFLDVFEPLLSVAYSHDGRFLATGATNGEIRLWDTRGKIHLATFHKHTDWVRNLVFSRSDGFLYSGGDDGAVYRWNLRTGQPTIVVENYAGRVMALDISPDGQMVATGGEEQVVHLWNTQDQVLLQEFSPKHENWIRSVAFSPDGNHLASASSDGTIRLWEVATGRCIRTLTEHNAYVLQVAFHPNGKLLASSDFAGVVCLWDISEGTCLRRYQTGERSVAVLTFHPDGSLLACGNMGGELFVWDGDSYEAITRFLVANEAINAIAFEPGGDEMAICYEDRSLNFVRTDTFQLVTRQIGYSGALYSVACSPQNPSLLASSGEIPTITIWNLDTGTSMQVLEGHSHRVFGMIFRSDGEKLLTTSFDRSLRIWDVKGGYCEQILMGHKAEIRAACWVGNDKIISTSPDLSIRIWDANTGEQAGSLHGAYDELYALALTPDLHLLAAAGEDHIIWIWDMETQELRGQLQGHTGIIWSLQFHSDGRTLISCSSDGSVRFWDIITQESIRVVRAHEDQVKVIALNQSGTILASASYDQTVKLWDTEAGNHLGTMTGHSDIIYSLSFTSDEQSVVSASQDGTLRIWDVNTATCTKVLRADRPYERMNITGAIGISESQRRSLMQLGTIEHPMQD